MGTLLERNQCVFRRFHRELFFAALHHGPINLSRLTQRVVVLLLSLLPGAHCFGAAPASAMSNMMSELSLPYTLEDLNQQNVWLVSNPGGLNCRTGPGSEYEIVYRLMPQFMALVAYDYVGERGVSNGSGLNWLRVVPKGPVHPEPCYVAADPRYIQPEYPDSTWRGGLQDRGQNDTCSSIFADSVNSVRILTTNHIIYLCTSAAQPRAKIQHYLSFRRDKAWPASPDLVLSNPEYDPRQGGQMIFRNSRYSYQIDLPSLRFPTAFLSVVFPDGSGYDEMIIEWLD